MSRMTITPEPNWCSSWCCAVPDRTPSSLRNSDWGAQWVTPVGTRLSSEDSPEQRLQAQGDVDCDTLGFGSSVLS